MPENLVAAYAKGRVSHRISTSGLLCRSTFCEEKFSKHIAASSVDRTAARYVANVFDCANRGETAEGSVVSTGGQNAVTGRCAARWKEIQTALLYSP